jgi:CarboxypepD_reg-like domain/TonB-dependent Receptor Plug Domain
MRKFTLLILCLLWLSIDQVAGQQRFSQLKGRVIDGEQHPLEKINIVIQGTKIGTTTNQNGEFLFRDLEARSVILLFSAIGYETIIREVLLPNQEPVVQILVPQSKAIQEIIISKRRESNNLLNIQSNLTEKLPSIGGSVETLIKTLPGVSSNNELTSQYSVRGGNFDENLVYVNGVEIIRPFLVKSGEQEGLSFINSEMVATIGFSAGGFDASFGDKMSSVLDISYRKPQRSGVRAEIGALGGSALFEGTSRNGKFMHMTGLRYKNTSYLLGTLDKKGEYNPSFTDFQTYLNYRLSKGLNIGFLANYASNTFQFIPQTQLTKFGTLTNPYEFMVYFDGREKDLFENYLGALTANYTPNSRLSLKLQASSFYSFEKESSDIFGEYYLSDISKNLDYGSNNDSTTVNGTGSNLIHTRNLLTANVSVYEQRGTYSADRHQLQWGLKYQHEKISYRINEWEMRDSAGYSIPTIDHTLALYHTINGHNKIASNRISGFVQDNWSKELATGVLGITGGIRFQNWDYNHQTIVSPRISASWKTGEGQSRTFRAAWGIYNQMPFFKELINQNAELIEGLKAQKSIHYLVGYDKIISSYERPIRFTVEAWYKGLSHLIPYQINNLNIQYLPGQTAKGYATGVDFKVNGELASGAQSWASLSLMKTAEDIMGDFYTKNLPSGESRVIFPGYIPRPTDQLINFSLFVQDYLPRYQSVKMSMTLFYGSRLPFGPPNGARYRDIFRMPPYQRVDVGFSKNLIGLKQKEGTEARRIKEASIGFEIFNLFDIRNTISYYWISDIKNQMHAVPNYLTGRRLNLKFALRF